MAAPPLPPTLLALALILVPAAAHGQQPAWLTKPQAVSLLGDTLRPMAPSSEGLARLQADLDSAHAAYDAAPDDADASIWLGRRLAYLGRYREAIDVFTEGARKHPGDPRLLRHRGHRWISVRELDRAVADLQLAAALMDGTPDRVEPDGAPNGYGIPRSTLHTNVWYHLGLAHYLRGDFAEAADAFTKGLAASGNDDMRVAMSDWLYTALRRVGRDADARRVLEGVRPEMDILENASYHLRLLMYKGEVAPQVLLDDEEADALTLATQGYGVGAWHLVNGDTARAARIFRRVLETGYWPAFGYIAAEAELARLRER